MPARCRQGFDKPACPVEVADERQCVDMCAHRVGDVAPSVCVGLQGQQVQEQLTIERPERRIVDGREPGGNTLWRVVADVLNLDGLRPDRCQLVGVLRADILLVGIRRQERFSLLPQLGELVVLSKR